MKAQFITPVITAFDKDLNIDIEANKNIWDFVIEGGVDGIILFGSTGEFFAISMEQKKELILAASEHINKRVPLIIGTGGMRIEETIELSNYCADLDVDGVIVVPPYYFALPEEGVEEYFNEVAKSVRTKIYIYNYPERTGYDISPELMLKLCRSNKNIVGCKDTVTNFAHTRELIKSILPEFPEFQIFSGYDDYFAHNVLSGGAGVIGGLSNVAPEVSTNWVKAVNNNDIEKVAYYQKQMDILASLFDFGVPFVPLVKKAMILRGIQIEDYCTKPLLPATDAQIEEIKAILSSINLSCV